MNSFAAAGVEVSAKILVVALQVNQHLYRKEFANTAVGHQQLVNWLRKHSEQVVRACLESTGLYGLDAAIALQAQPGIEVMVANPHSVRHFGQAMMNRSKNDPIDALLLSEYAQRMPFKAWQPPSAVGRQLCAITRAMQQLTEMCTMQKNRLHAASVTVTTPKIIVRELERSLAQLQKSVQRLQDKALQLVRADAQLKQQLELLDGIPGIAELSALQILGEVVLLSADMDVRDWVAYAGLDPRQYKSGESVEKKIRINKIGNKHLRRVLYMPVLVAVRHNPHFRGYYFHLRGKGKLKKVALVALMRKLLHGIYGVLKSMQPFDATKLFTLPLPLDQKSIKK